MGKRFPTKARTLGAGVCRFCGCSEYDPCPHGCAWAGASHTVCTECYGAADAERRALPMFSYHGEKLAAFHRGFVVGWFRLRSARARNPYAAGDVFKASSRELGLAYAWNRGREQGRHGRTAYGPVLNAPRPFVYERPKRAAA